MVLGCIALTDVICSILAESGFVHGIRMQPGWQLYRLSNLDKIQLILNHQFNSNVDYSPRSN
jgi:hypothetical protein